MGKVIFLLFIAFAVITGCTSTAENKTLQRDSNTDSFTQEIHNQNEKAYSPSSIHPDFPVPKQAKKTNHRSNNPKITYVRYAFQGLMKMNKRNQYFAEIEKWGWREKKQEQMGSMHVFEKGREKIHLTVHSDFFTLFSNKK